jgi:hypothetical protein
MLIMNAFHLGNRNRQEGVEHLSQRARLGDYRDQGA